MSESTSEASKPFVFELVSASGTPGGGGRYGGSDAGGWGGARDGGKGGGVVDGGGGITGLPGSIATVSPLL